MKRGWWELVPALAWGVGCAGAGPSGWAPEPRVVAEAGATSLAPQPASVPDTIRAAFRLVLNIPAYRLDVYDGLQLVRRFAVAVGGGDFPTPVGKFRITRIEWNPWWVPPASDWARADTVTPPGPLNPMGRVKLFFQDGYFLHGTPQPASVGSAASHGCVRLANRDAMDLAILVHRYASPELRPEDLLRLASLKPTDRTLRVPLRYPVPLEIRYDVVEVLGDRLLVHTDIYRRAGGAVAARAIEALTRLGLDPATIDSARLGRLAGDGSGGCAPIPIAELLTR